ncbi:hypothetical protein J1N35_025192 [Gossypium stocksii]|uniref:Uncharacterized protein n=1 Tax=Gossypium stocksii TaxID=47602 RepID=A0A9D3V5Y9_9ROSI|nr:hypothetical protein J1N35_025192 [Gossypium stocksii]
MSRVGAKMGLSSIRNQQEAPIVAPPPGQYDSTYTGAFTNLVILTQAPHYASSYPTSTPAIGMFSTPTLSPLLHTNANDNTNVFATHVSATSNNSTILSATSEGDEDEHDDRNEDEDEEEEESKP